MNNILDRIEPREDGVYFLVDYKKSNPKEDIVEIVKKYSIKDFDPSTIDKVIEESSKYIFITKDKDAINIDEKFDIIVSKDRMLAEVKFKAPFKNGNVLSKQQILDKISESNVVFGLDFSDIENFICNRDYNKSYVIAKGIQPEESKNGFLEYHVDISKKTTKPKVLEDGTLDYRELNMFESVHKDQTLVTRVDAIKGADGRNVYDEVVPSKLPKEAPTLAQGKNTRISEDGKLLLSNIDGCVAMKGKTVNILPVLEIESDVDTSIGNIEFIGSILIKGNVLSGFTVSAGGDIDILGVVEDSNIIANGNISIAKGVQGGGKARIIASENINLNFENKKQQNIISFRESISKGVKPGYIDSINKYTSLIDKKIEDQKVIVNKAKDFVEEKRLALLEAMKQRKVLEALKEKGKENYFKEELKKEQKMIDEIVSYKYNKA